MTDAQRYEEIFRTITDAVNRGDLDKATSYFAADGVMIDYCDPSTVHKGRAQFKAAAEAYYELVSEIELRIVDLVVQDNRVAAEMVFRGVPKNGGDVIEVGAALFHVYRDDELISEHVYIDSAQLPSAS